MLLTIIVSLALIGIDQLLKHLAAFFLAPAGEVALIPGVVGLKYVENTGAAFSILTDKQPFLIAVTGLALLVVAWVLLFRRPKGRLEYAALLLIFAGGVGNLVDRIANGYVVDYVNLLFMNFAVFNFADMLVVTGFILFVIALFKAEVKARRGGGKGAAGPGEGPGGGEGPEGGAGPEAEAVPEGEAEPEAADAGAPGQAPEGGALEADGPNKLEKQDEPANPVEPDKQNNPDDQDMPALMDGPKGEQAAAPDNGKTDGPR